MIQVLRIVKLNFLVLGSKAQNPRMHKVSRESAKSGVSVGVSAVRRQPTGRTSASRMRRSKPRALSGRGDRLICAT